MKEILGLVRGDYLKILYTHVAHEEASKRYKGYKKYYNIANYSIVILLLFLLVFQLAELEKGVKNFLLILSIILTVLELGLIIFESFFKILDKEHIFKKIALDLLELRDEYIFLMALIIGEKTSNKDITQKVENVRKRKNLLLKESPGTLDIDYEKSKLFLDPNNKFSGGGSEVNEKEIDYNLPKNLRLGKG